MAERTTTFEERKERRIAIAARPGTMVLQPQTRLTRDLYSYLRTIDRGTAKIQQEVFQPGRDKAVIEQASAIIEDVITTMEDAAREIAELADIRFFDPKEPGPREESPKRSGKPPKNDGPMAA